MYSLLTAGKPSAVALAAELGLGGAEAPSALPFEGSTPLNARNSPSGEPASASHMMFAKRRNLFAHKRHSQPQHGNFAPAGVHGGGLQPAKKFTVFRVVAKMQKFGSSNLSSHKRKQAYS